MKRGFQLRIHNGLIVRVETNAGNFNARRHDGNDTQIFIVIAIRVNQFLAQ